MNKILLYLVMLPSSVWKSAGANVEQLRAILDIKLKMDDRKPLSFGKQQRKNSRFTSVLTMVLSFFVGIIYVLPLTFSETEPVFSLWLFYTLFLLFLVFTLITDFSNVLVDSKDKLIIFPKPVNDRTIFLAKSLHIFIYLFRIMAPMTLPGWIVFSLIKGWKAAIWFPIPVLLLMFIALMVVNGMYLLLIRVSKNKFKEVINYFQIIVSILFFAGIYLLPKFLNPETLADLDIQQFSNIQYTPSYWLAACWTWVEPSASVFGSKWWSLGAIIFPLLCIWVTVKWLAPGFMKQIAAIDSVENIPAPKAKVKKQNLPLWLANILNRNNTSRAGFILTWVQTARSRSFKMKVYPFFAYAPVYFIYMVMMNDKQSISATWAELPESNKFLLLLYISGLVLMQAVNYIAISDQYKASWVYFSSPIEKPGYVMAGGFKAMWVKYYLPYSFVISAFVLYVWGLSSILDILLATVNVTLFGICILRITYRTFPFSLIEQNMNSGAGAALRGFITMTVIGLLGLFHYLSLVFWWLKLIFLVLSATFLWLVWDSYKNTSWENIKQAED